MQLPFLRKKLPKTLMLGMGILCLSKSLKSQSAMTLPFLQHRHYQIALENGLYAVYRENNQVISSARSSDFFLISQYDEKAGEADLGFGSLHVPTDFAERVPLDKGEKDRRIRGILPKDGTLFLLDSDRRQFLLWQQKQKIWLRPSDIIFDRVKPPADPRGEPTRWEISQQRAAMRNAYSALSQEAEVLVGLSQWPSFWKNPDKADFLMLTRLKGFPLLSVKCEGKSSSYCYIVRSCFVHGLKSSLSPLLSGLAVDAKRREILIGIPLEKRIARLKATSCYHLAKTSDQKDILLPEELKNLSNLFIDVDNNLWLTLQRPDLYKSASLFRYDAEVWAK